MSRYEKNITVSLARNAARNPVHFQGAETVDHIAILNQYHTYGTWELDVINSQVFWSPETYQIHGLEPGMGNVGLETVMKFYLPEDARRLNDLLSTAIKLRTGFQCKLRIRRRDGALRVCEAIAAPVLSEGGKLLRLAGILRDVTSQTEYENSRIAQQELIRTLIATLPIGAALLDTNFRYVSWSAAFLASTELPVETDLAGRSHFEVHPVWAEHMRVVLDIALRGSVLGRDNDTMPFDGERAITHDWRLIPWMGPTGLVSGLLLLTFVKSIGEMPEGMREKGGIEGPFHRDEKSALEAFSSLLSRHTSS